MPTIEQLFQQFKSMIFDLIKGESGTAIAQAADYMADNKELLTEIITDKVNGGDNDFFLEKMKEQGRVVLSQALSITQMEEANIEEGINNIITTITGQIEGTNN